jgi:hypothetical protein
MSDKNDYRRFLASGNETNESNMQSIKILFEECFGSKLFEPNTSRVNNNKDVYEIDSEGSERYLIVDEREDYKVPESTRILEHKLNNWQIKYEQLGAQTFVKHLNYGEGFGGICFNLAQLSGNVGLDRKVIYGLKDWGKNG